MTYGLELFNSAGTKVFSSTGAQAGCLIGVIHTTSGYSTVHTYPAFAGRGVLVLGISGGLDPSITTDTALGYPRVTLPSGLPGVYVFLVFAT